MQVTHVKDHVSHAVIGKNEAKDFGISNSAEFFNILSNSLYSDKILAVVREVLCNAWDIHIQNGKTDVPVEITLKDGYLTIRDHGVGIHDDDMHEIYAVYGNSTKKLDGTQTGGFGLGSKSPFAYVDHFEVTSRHQGKKTVYAISKSSAEVAGKPSITPLLSVACDPDDNGLSVKLAVKSEDFPRFRQVIETIARFGEMNATIDTDRNRGADPEKLDTLPFSKAKHGFLMIRDVRGVSGGDNNNIFVRYGNVVYPVPRDDGFGPLYDKTKEIIEKIGKEAGYYRSTFHWNLVLQAKPDTISVTPSRESLSMTEHTISALNDLLSTFTSMTDAQLEDACVDLERTYVSNVASKGCPGALLTKNDKVPTLFDEDGHAKTDMPEIITDVRDMARSTMSLRYPDIPGFRIRDIEMRLETLEKMGFGGPKNRGKIQSFRREYKKVGNAKGSTWFNQTIVAPLMKKLDATEHLQGAKLLAYATHNDERTDVNGRRLNWSAKVMCVNAPDLSPRSLEGYLPFLRNIIVLSFNRIDIEDRLGKFPQFKEKLGSRHDFLAYVVPRTTKKVEEARKFFKDLGMTVLDLTVAQSWEPKTIVQPTPKPKVTKPRLKGLPLLSGVLQTLEGPKGPTQSINYERYLPTSQTYQDMKRTENPEFIVQFNPRAQSANLFPGLYKDGHTLIAQLFGDRGAVTTTSNQTDKFNLKQGIPLLKEWIFDELLRELDNNPNLCQVFGYSHEKINDDSVRQAISHSYEKKGLFNTILMYPEIAIEFGVLNVLTDRDRQYKELIDAFVEGRSWEFRHMDGYQKLIKRINEIPLSPGVEDFAKLISKSNLTKLISPKSFSELFGKEKPTAAEIAERTAAIDIIQYALA
ncbi:MAG: hypothetical protein Unbinned4120contig1000_61 [Prokaryotic dsDNA virus sp.]|nr:MAG: hypothetical protein Unbinned4120contig1000_61 [Prokaryotic dsDNA virus sp.]